MGTCLLARGAEGSSTLTLDFCWRRRLAKTLHLKGQLLNSLLKWLACVEEKRQSRFAGSVFSASWGSSLSLSLSLPLELIRKRLLKKAFKEGFAVFCTQISYRARELPRTRFSS